ncbi:WbqC family protein [Streptomyces sp. NPDC000961]|uniref:WbqC family protein n=1 Tax=Streptomyces TaxID=1883 RepID=UPI00369376E1
MSRTNPSSTSASPADSSAPDKPPPGGLCAIHQPNFFPRLSTLAKIFAADYWIVLDDVQFARRDYQHRARLGSTSDPVQHQWLSIPTHLPRGRSTLVGEAVLVDPERSRRRVMLMLAQHYGDCPDWPLFRHELESVLLQFRRTGRTADVAEESTRILLRLLGWKGRILHSSWLPARTERSQRLADLAAATGSRGYLCGSGGMRYLDVMPFAVPGVAVVPFVTPTVDIWEDARLVSAVHPLMTTGIPTAAEQLRAVASRHTVVTDLAQSTQVPGFRGRDNSPFLADSLGTKLGDQ